MCADVGQVATFTQMFFSQTRLTPLFLKARGLELRGYFETCRNRKIYGCHPEAPRTNTARRSSESMWMARQCSRRLARRCSQPRSHFHRRRRPRCCQGRIPPRPRTCRLHRLRFLPRSRSSCTRRRPQGCRRRILRNPALARRYRFIQEVLAREVRRLKLQAAAEVCREFLVRTPDEVEELARWQPPNYTPRRN